MTRSRPVVRETTPFTKVPNDFTQDTSGTNRLLRSVSLLIDVSFTSLKHYLRPSSLFYRLIKRIRTPSSRSTSTVNLTWNFYSLSLPLVPPTLKSKSLVGLQTNGDSATPTHTNEQENRERRTSPSSKTVQEQILVSSSLGPLTQTLRQDSSVSKGLFVQVEYL